MSNQPQESQERPEHRDAEGYTSPSFSEQPYQSSGNPTYGDPTYGASQPQPGGQPAPYQQGYAPAGYGYGGPEHPQATTILILGIVGLFVAITGPFAWIMGNKARKEIAAGQYAPSTSLTVGWVLGIISTIYLVVMVVAVVLAVVAMMATVNG